MDRRSVVYRGVRMMEGWPEKIREAQRETTYAVRGREIRRVPYGAEADDWGAGDRACADCGVIEGELHVPGCDIEQCPACGDQAITCGCRSD